MSMQSVLMGSVASLPSALHSREDLKALFQACYDVAVGKLWYTPLPSGPSAANAEMLAASKQLVVQTYQDAAEVARDARRLRGFCALPFAAVLAWAESDQLQVHSENCVVYLLSAWVKAQQQQGGQGVSYVSAAQLEQLAHQVRVLHLTPAYQYHVLCNLWWFKGCSSMPYLPMLLAYKGVGKGNTAAAVYPAPNWHAGAHGDHSWAWQGAAQWVAGPRKQAPSTYGRIMHMLWELSPDQLQQLCGGARVVLPGPRYHNGLLFSLILEQEKAAGGHVTLGMYCHIASDEMAQLTGIAWPAVASVPVGTIAFQVHAPNTPNQAQAAWPMFYNGLAIGSLGMGTNNLLRKSAANFHELVQPLLMDGKLTVEAILLNVDMLPRKA